MATDWADLHKQRKKTDSERFWEKVDKSGDCWEWLAGKDLEGYGRFWINGSTIMAHRASMIIDGVDIPDAMYVCHHCDNTSCVNPTHLFLGSHKDNMADRRSKGRDSLMQGENSPMAKLTENDVRRIRRMINSGAMQTSLAERFGVSRSLINAIKFRRIWPHVD